MYIKTYYPDYLAHHGIKGMKWGVRRYRNYDGSYTKAGLKRYNKALNDYESKKKTYEGLKIIAKKNGVIMDPEGNAYRFTSKQAAKSSVKDSKMEMKRAKKELTKHYKHLKQDKLADEGKKLYSQGKTIGENRTNTYLKQVGGYAIASTLLESESKYAKAAGLFIGSLTLTDTIIKADENRKLRAYYAHTSNY